MSENESIRKELKGDQSNTTRAALTPGLNITSFMGFDVIRSMIREYVTPKAKTATFQYGIVLHKSEPEKAGKNTRVWVRVPKEHCMIPAPRSSEDWDLIEMHGEYYCNEDELGGSPLPGQVVRVTARVPGDLVGSQVGKVEEITGLQEAFVAGGVGNPSETFMSCFFGDQPPSFVMSPRGESSGDGDVAAEDLTTEPGLLWGRNDRVTQVDGRDVKCGEVFKMASMENNEPKDVSQLKLSLAGAIFIHGAEAFRAKPYEDANTRKLWTVGWGSKIDRRDADGAVRYAKYSQFVVANGGTAVDAAQYKGQITKAQADAIFNIDATNAERYLRNRFKGVKLRQTQFDALISIVYNAGQIYNKLTAAITRNPDDPGLAAAFASHAITAGKKNGVPKVNKGVAKRRSRELDYYFGKLTTKQMKDLQKHHLNQGN